MLEALAAKFSILIGALIYTNVSSCAGVTYGACFRHELIRNRPATIDEIDIRRCSAECPPGVRGLSQSLRGLN